MARDVSSGDDVVDSRDIEARIEELEGQTVACGDCDGNGNKLGEAGNATDDECLVCKGEGEVLALDEVEKEELATLVKLREECEGYGEWRSGITLVRDSYFEDYAREYASDIHGSAAREMQWPYNCIDWKEAAEEMQQDYTSVEWDGVTYWFR